MGRLVAGVDVAMDADFASACAVVIELPSLEPVEVVCARARVEFPYIPGLLSFREAPITLAALYRLTSAPCAVLLDGQGIAHPRRLGFASHVGLWIDVPAVGVAKSLLVGEYLQPTAIAGSKEVLRYRGSRIGYSVRTRDGVSPVFVSPGNHIGFLGSVRLAMRCCGGYRIPEPTRMAHTAGVLVRRGMEESQVLSSLRASWQAAQKKRGAQGAPS